MALSELAAFEAAYDVLRPLDAAARRRALQWLSDALGAGVPLPAIPSANPPSTPEPTTDTARTGTRRAAGGRRAATAAAATSRGTGRRSRRGQATVTGDGAGRAYRKMPPADEVMAAYDQVGSVSGLADHFRVPIHTVQGWARRLRGQGFTIGRKA